MTRLWVSIALTACVAMVVVPGTVLAAEGQPADAPGLDAAFEALAKYEDGQPLQPLRTIQLAVARASGVANQRRMLADRLAKLLADASVSQAAKEFACTQLAVVADELHVPLLAGLLGDARLADGARRALAAIPGDAAGSALREAAGKLKGKALIGVVHTLGARRDAKSVPALAGLLGQGDAEVAAAAAGALGRIGTAEAAAALAKADAPALRAKLLDARLRCAEALAASGDKAAAEAMYRAICSAEAPVHIRVAALAGLAASGGEKALPELLKAMDSPDSLMRATALALVAQVPGAKATAALVERLESAAGPARAELIGVLAQRGDRAAGPAVLKFLASQDGAVQLAAVGAAGSLGDASAVAPLLRLAARVGQLSELPPRVAPAARVSLDRLNAAGVDEALLAAAGKVGQLSELPPPIRAEAIRALSVRRARGAEAALVGFAGDADEAVRLAALAGLGAMGEAACYGKLIELAVSGPRPATTEAAEKAALAVGARLAGRDERAKPLLAALAKAPAGGKPALLRLLAACGGPPALQAVRGCLTDSDPAIADAAVRALAAWADADAAEDLLTIAREGPIATHKALALRGYLRLARTAVVDAAGRLKMLQRAKETAASPADRKLLLAALADVPDAAALELAVSFLADAEVRMEAALAAMKIAEALPAAEAAAVKAAMQQLQAKLTDETLLARAKAIQAAAGARRPAGQQNAAALQADPKRTEAARKELAKRAPSGFRLACYLDCGPDDADGAKVGPTLRALGGQKYAWGGADAAAPVRFGTVQFDGQTVSFEAAGLDPKRSYRLGFSWWDYDHNTRAESVWASAAGGQPVRLLAATKLPSGAEGKAPAEHTLDLPRGLTAGGKVQVTFRNEGGPNAVVSEVWLWESEAASEPPAGAASATVSSSSAEAAPAARPPAEPAAEPKPFKPGKKGQKRVLIITGIDYPGHKWRETTPVLAAGLDADERLAVDVVESPAFLASPKLADYAAIVLHFMNWQTPDPGEPAREGLRRYVAGGGGLVLVHFACGAFQGWPEFAKIAGRAWDPKLRGHDPHGDFQVKITDPNHPITKGMKDFQTRDELYTCLAGDTAIHVIASATSKVDKKDYPMGFVLSYGKGRVFHSVLGHDAKAFPPPVCELYRRATAWAAGLPPQEPPAGK